MHVIKKRNEPSKDGEDKQKQKDGKEKSDPINIDKILTGALSRGLNFEGVKEMELGQIVDFCIEYNKQNGIDTKGKTNEDRPKKRKATQKDWDAFFG